MSSYDSPIKPRRSTTRSHREVAKGTPGKRPPAKRSGAAADSSERREISRRQRGAKAREGAAKYLDGDFGTPGSNFSLKKAADWVKAELEDEQQWPTNRLAYIT